MKRTAPLINDAPAIVGIALGVTGPRAAASVSSGGRNCQQRTLMLKDMRLTAVDGTPSGSRRGAVAWIVLVLGAVALLLLGLWTTSAHDSIERSAATATVSIGGDRAPSDSAVSDAEVVVVLAPEGAGAEETALCSRERTRALRRVPQQRQSNI